MEKSLWTKIPLDENNKNHKTKESIVNTIKIII